MPEQRLHAFAPAMNNVENAARKAGLFQQSRNHHRGQRHLLARFKHKSIPASQRDGVHPERHHRRKIKRCDPDTNAKGLANGFAVNSARDVLDCLATEQRGHATGKLHHLDSSPNITARFDQGLAVFARVAACDLFELLLADIGTEQTAGRPVKGKAPWIAESKRPDLGRSAAAHKRVIRRNCIWQRAAGVININAQHFAEQVAERLRVAAVGVFADADVQLAVGAEVQRTAVMIGGARQRIQVEQIDLAARHGHVAVGGEATDAVVRHRCRGRVIDVDEMIGRKGGVERNADQAALAGGIDGQADERRRQKMAGIVDHAQAAALLGHEDPSVGRQLHRRRSIQAGSEHRLAEAWRQAGRCQTIF